MDAHTRLLDPEVRWGSAGDPAPPCRSRAQVLAWYQRGRDARLAARWLLHDRHADLVELRIGQSNAASQRVASAAGFTPAGRETGEDLRFIVR